MACTPASLVERRPTVNLGGEKVFFCKLMECPFTASRDLAPDPGFEAVDGRLASLLLLCSEAVSIFSKGFFREPC